MVIDGALYQTDDLLLHDRGEIVVFDELLGEGLRREEGFVEVPEEVLLVLAVVRLQVDADGHHDVLFLELGFKNRIILYLEELGGVIAGEAGLGGVQVLQPLLDGLLDAHVVALHLSLEPQ